MSEKIKIHNIIRGKSFYPRVKKSGDWMIVALLLLIIFSGSSFFFKKAMADTANPQITVLNNTPLVGTVTLNGGSDIVLIENTTKTVQATATVSDVDGYEDIVSIEGKIFRSGAGADCSANNNNCYLISSCATSSCATSSCVATCQADIYFHADPTDASSSYPGEYWDAQIKAIDSESASSSATSSGVELNTLRSLNLSATSIDYGTLSPNQDTETLNNTTTITNTGNESIHIYLYGTNLESTSTASDWYDSNWSYRKEITIDNTKVDDDLTDFPILVSTTSADLSSKAQSDGDDILFTSSNGTTKLSHEIERYSSSTGELIAWVKVPSLSSSTDTDLYMYYGNAGASNQEQATSVWSNNYRGVYHLSESSGLAQDSSPKSYHSPASTSVQAQGVAGKIGNCYEWSNAEHKVKIPLNIFTGDNGASGLDSFTLEMWHFSHEAGGANNPLYSLEIESNGHWEISQQANIWRFRPAASNENECCDTDVSYALTQNAWEYAAIKWTSTSIISTYKNGQFNASANPGASAVHIQDSDSTEAPTINAIGWNQDNGGFDGLIDEVRISSVERSAAWLSTSYNTMNSPSTFMSFGSEEASGTADYIPVQYQQYSLSPGTSYGDGTSATSSTSTVVVLDLSKPTSSPSTSTDDIYWGIGIPVGQALGFYSGTTTFEAKDD